MSISMNWELIENNFDLVRKFDKEDTLLARADHRLYSGFINKMWYTPASTVDIEWTEREVNKLQSMPIDRRDEKNESLLILQGKVTNLDYFFREGIRRFNEAHPPAVVNTEAPKPPVMPQPGAKQKQGALWRKNSSGIKILTIVANAPEVPRDFRGELQQRITNGFGLKKVTPRTNTPTPTPLEQRFIDFRATTAASDDEGEESEITSAWK